MNAASPRDASYNAAGMGMDELLELFCGLGEPAYRAQQAFEGFYRNRWRGWGQFTNFPKDLRARLEAMAPLQWPAIDQTFASLDGSVKHALKLSDGCLIECVYMPFENRATLCLSSQVGCAMGCTFCATGSMGLTRNLAAAEIVGQAMSLLDCHPAPQSFPINIVFMGMGEPLHNFENVMAAFEVLCHPKGLALPQRRATLSTAGLVPGIAQLGRRSPRPRLAVSLNATTDEARSKIMPIGKKWGLDNLAGALADFPLRPGEKVTLEYVMIEGISDSMEDASRLSAFASKFPSKMNLIPYNACSIPGQPGFSPPSENRLNKFGANLARMGHDVAVRRSRGGDIAGACGQLALRK